MARRVDASNTSGSTSRTWTPRLPGAGPSWWCSPGVPKTSRTVLQDTRDAVAGRRGRTMRPSRTRLAATGRGSGRARWRSWTRGAPTWSSSGPSTWNGEAAGQLASEIAPARYAARVRGAHACALRRTPGANSSAEKPQQTRQLEAAQQAETVVGRAAGRPGRPAGRGPTGIGRRTSGCCPVGATKWPSNVHGSRACGNGRPCWRNWSGATRD